jgi:uncharacterized protein YgfB (UPF0149 family)
MFDEFGEEVGIFDFDELANHLLEQGLDASPAQLHGCLSGLLAAGAEPEAELGLDALTQVLVLPMHGELASRVMQLYTVTAAALEDDEFSFYPLLPDDEVEIDLRTEALAQWCHGFLAGFARTGGPAEVSSGTLSEDGGEALTDIAAMAEAALGEEEGGEEAETSYVELVEYLRFAVLNVFMESRASLQDKRASSQTKQPLH